MKTGIIVLLGFFWASLQVLGHGSEDHKKKKKVDSSATVINESSQQVTTKHEHQEKQRSPTHHNTREKVRADFKDFPTLHPLVVHFPIVLLLLAAISQLTGLFVFKNELSWVTLFLVIGGFIGAYIAGSYVHPHTTGLSEYAEKVLKEHEGYASYTTWFAGIAALFKVISHFALKRKLWGEIIVAIALIASAYAVSNAGHLGAQLIHIEGIGAQGKHLETGKHNH